MTRVFNKRYFDHVVEREVERARQHDLPLSLLMFDLDHFARCNETYSPRVGDDVLRQVAEVASRRSRKVDVVARYAGQRFTVLLPNTALPTAARAAESLRKAVEDGPASFDGREIAVTISVGVAALDDDTDAAALVERAEATLAAAKRSGRNAVRA